MYLCLELLKIFQQEWQNALNPSSSGGRDQENCNSKPAWANSSRDTTLKIPNTKKGWWSGLRCRPWVQTPALQKKKEWQNKKVTTYPTCLTSQSCWFLVSWWDCTCSLEGRLEMPDGISGQLKNKKGKNIISKKNIKTFWILRDYTTKVVV
jgi:hypothetical protein